MPSRRRAARDRRRRRRNLLFQSWRPPGRRRHSGARHAARGGEGGRKRAGHVRFWDPIGDARRQGSRDGRGGGRDRPPLCLRASAGRDRRNRPRAAVSARRGRSPDGRRRIPDLRRPQAGDVAARRALTRERWARLEGRRSYFRSRIRASYFGETRPGGTAPVTISCRKSEIWLSLPHEQSVPSPCPNRGQPSRRIFRDDKSARKNFSQVFSRNPLISLNPDERIQGNPRKSNSPKPGVFAAKRRCTKKTHVWMPPFAQGVL